MNNVLQRFSAVELTLLVVFVSPAAVVPPAASGAKPQPSYSYSQPGQLFQSKVESSSAAATKKQTWRIMESLNLGPQPKATAVPSFTTGSATMSTANQDFSTVNMADLHEFAPNISSAIAQESAASQGSAAAAQTGSSFTLQGSQFRADVPLMDDDIPEFPSFSEALDSLNMDDFVDLLSPPLMSESGNGAAMLAQASCQQAANPSSSIAAHNSAASQNTCDPASNPGSTWMNYPNSIASLLQTEGMIDMAPNNHQRPAVLDDFDELIADEDRLISILNSGSQAGFVSGHPT